MTTRVQSTDFDAIQKAAADLSDKMMAICESVEELTKHVMKALRADQSDKKDEKQAKAVSDLKGLEKNVLTVSKTFSQAVEELCVALCSHVAGSDTAVAPKGTNSLKSAGKPDTPPPKPPRDLTVPPPPSVSEHAPVSQAVRQINSPNPALARAMAGKKADWKRIRSMAENIRKPDYLIRNFFDDCVHSFPELALFFEGPSALGGYHGTQALSSGRSGEAEYQRTIGALFVVYWMLRLDKDGRSGFCYGVDEHWRPIPDPPTKKVGGSFFKMTPDEKRASAMCTMDWAQFQQLVDRAGCGEEKGNIERVMALLCLTAFHDIMKVAAMQPIVQPEHAPYQGVEAGVRINDHDLALSYVLDKFPQLLPSFDGLPADAKRGVMLTQSEMQFNHGWFVQSEAPPGMMLSKFKKVLQAGSNRADIDLYFLHWITDLAGALATPLGGAEKLVLSFPHHVLASFLWSMPYLSKLTDATETVLVEDYLEARWSALLPKEPVPTDHTSITLMRLVVMAQAEDAMLVIQAFQSMPVADQSVLVSELSRSGCDDQNFKKHSVSGGPAFLIYYAPALLQRNAKTKELLEAALHCLCVVYRAARAVWPSARTTQGSTVIIQVAELKSREIIDIIRDPGGETRYAWLLIRNNDQEGEVTLGKPNEINSLHLEGLQFRVLDFARESRQPEAQVSTKRMSNPRGSGLQGRLAMSSTRSQFCKTDSEAIDYTSRGQRRILVFTDMSTECDDECALLWLVAALNRNDVEATVELVVTDTHARFQWMAHIFSDKFQPGGPWKLNDMGSTFIAGCVKVKMYLIKCPEKEREVIDKIRHEVPDLELDVEEDKETGKTTAVWRNCIIGGRDMAAVQNGPLDAIVVAAAPNNVEPSFFNRFTKCKCAYVVGTPGGINCPMPAWTGILASLHVVCPVLYLTPQFTRSVRFPRQYVKSNTQWNETIRQTVWTATFNFMVKRPELPVKSGNWGLILRLNTANAQFCKDWYFDIKGSKVEEAPRPDYVVRWVQAYVDRMSTDERAQGAVLDELRNIGVDVSAWGLGLSKKDEDATGKLTSPAAKEAIRAMYRKKLFEQTLICVHTADALLFQNKKNLKVSADAAGYEELRAQCGWVNPEENLSEVFGLEQGIKCIKELPLRWLTPAYDVVAMICADASLDEGTEIDGGLGLLMADADDTMGLGLLTEEQRHASSHRVLMTLPQMGEGIYRVGPFT